MARVCLLEGETGRVGHFPFGSAMPAVSRSPRSHVRLVCLTLVTSPPGPSRVSFLCSTGYTPTAASPITALSPVTPARPAVPAPALPDARLPQQHSPPRHPLAPGMLNQVVPPCTPHRVAGRLARDLHPTALSRCATFPPKLLRSGFSHQEPADPWYVAPYQEQDPCSRTVRLPSRRPGKAGASQLARNSISSASLHRGAKTRCAPALRLGQQVATASHRGTTSSSVVRARPAQPQPVQHHEHADIAP